MVNWIILTLIFNCKQKISLPISDCIAYLELLSSQVIQVMRDLLIMLLLVFKLMVLSILYGKKATLAV